MIQPTKQEEQLISGNRRHERSSSMNVLLWVLQAALALLCLAGGSYKAFMFDQVASEAWYGALPRGGWGALGVFEMVGGVLLVVPGATKWMPVLTPLAAAALVGENLALSALYA